MELEKELTGAKSKAEKFEPKIVDEELAFERKTVVQKVAEAPKAAPVPEVNELDLDVDPMNTPIEDLLKNRADERRRKLKDFNHKFKNNINNVNDMETKPAYLRQGVDLNQNNPENRMSRTTLSDDGDDIQLRSNNSYLHDNVD